MGSLEEVITVSLAEMEDGEIVDHGDGNEIDVFSYKNVMPMCATLATIYFLAPIQNAVVESIFSHQNLILTNRRFRMVIDKVGIKVFIKNCFFLFSEEQIEKILDKATKKWLVKDRRLGRRKT